MRKGIFALEELNEVPAEEVVAATPEELEIEEEAGAPEQVEAEESVEVAEQIEEAISDASETVETLERVREEIGGSLEEGGMSEPEARALEVAVEHMCAAIGMAKKSHAFPAMEGFADKATRKRNTELAMESISDKVKAIGERILKAIMAAIEYVKTFFVSLFNASEGLARKAASIVEAAKKVKDGSEDGKTVSGSFTGILTVGGKFVEGADLDKTYTEHTGLLDAAAKDIATFKGFDEKIEKALDGGKEEVAAIHSEIGSMFKAGKHEKDLSFGGKKFVVKPGDDGVVRVEISGDDVKAGGPVPAASAKVVAELAKAVGSNMQRYSEVKSTSANIVSEMNKLMAKVKASVSKEGVVSNDIYKAVQSYNNLFVGSQRLLRSYDLKVSAAVLDYSAKSLKAAAGGKQAEAQKALPAPAKA